MSPEHIYQQMGLLSEEKREGIDDAQSVVTSKARTTHVRRIVLYLIFHLVLLVFYIVATYWLFRSSQNPLRSFIESKNPLLTWSPAQDAIEYEKWTFNAAPNNTSPYVGESTPELDQAWHELLKYTNMRVSKDDLEKVNRNSIPLGNGGGYYGEMAVFHELHCLKYLRQSRHMDYYGHTFGSQEKALMAEHTEHCIELLRQGVMCRGDTTLVTFHWGPTVKLPQPDFTLEHTCVNWDNLMQWAKPRAINVFEEGMLLHPKFGPSYPGGHREDRPLPDDAKPQEVPSAALNHGS